MGEAGTQYSSQMCACRRGYLGNVSGSKCRLRGVTPSRLGVEEVVATAQRRAQNMKDVPVAIQAFTGETLQQRNDTRFDLIKHLPNVTAPSSAFGQCRILHERTDC